jgi:GTP-binding protein LepA
VEQSHIRNFSIVAHIDHGKSTLADRILQLSGAVSERDMREQMLDSMDLERERGITIKAQAVRVPWTYQGEQYELNLIDTPGHVDFSYEVSRSLAACEGAILVVDAAQGLEAQTLANAHLALDNDLEIVPVLNKIDLPAADPEGVARQVVDFLGGGVDSVLRISAKTGAGVREVLDAVCERVPPPGGDPSAPARALVFDSTYDQYRGVIAFVRVVDGAIASGDEIIGLQSNVRMQVEEIGVMTPSLQPIARLEAGEVGFIVTGIKDVSEVRVGDTFTHLRGGAKEPLPGYLEVKPMVFAGLFPTDADSYQDLRDALDKLRLNDASLVYEPETSQALGFGFRCGFLGLLHMDVVRERLEREFDLDLLMTTPNVAYEVMTTHGMVEVHNPSQMPDANSIVETHEPYVKASLIVPKEYVGTVMELAQERRGEFDHMEYLSQTRVQVIYQLPLAEIVLDFYDQLKSRTRGYASFDYELSGYRSSNLVKLDILLNGEPVDALSLVVHRDRAYEAGKALVDRLRRVIPRQLFDVPIQASIGSRIIAEEGQEAHEDRRHRRSAPGGIPGGALARRRGCRQALARDADRGHRARRMGAPGALAPAARARRDRAALRLVRGARGRRWRGCAGAPCAGGRDPLPHGARKRRRGPCGRAGTAERRLRPAHRSPRASAEPRHHGLRPGGRTHDPRARTE